MKCTKGLLGLGANNGTHQQFLASILKIEKPVSLHKLSLTGTEIPLYSSFGLFLKSVQGIKRFDIARVAPATEFHHRGVIASYRYPLLHSPWKP